MTVKDFLNTVCLNSDVRLYDENEGAYFFGTPETLLFSLNEPVLNLGVDAISFDVDLGAIEAEIESIEPVITFSKENLDVDEERERTV